jgi:hypothetical protein
MNIAPASARVISTASCTISRRVSPTSSEEASAAPTRPNEARTSAA